MIGSADTRAAGLLWSRFIWRHWRNETGLTLLLVGVLALGVAVFLSIRLANKAAVSGFSLFTESIAGESDLILRPQAGMLSNGDLVDLRRQMGALPVGIFPVLEASGAPAENPETGLLRLIGTDLVALRNAATYTDSKPMAPVETEEKDEQEEKNEGKGEGKGEGLQLGRRDLGFVGIEFFEKYGTDEGEVVGLLVNDTVVDLEIGGVLPDYPNRPSVPPNLVVMDLPGLQVLLGKEELSRIELRIPPGAAYGRIKEEAGRIATAFADGRNLIVETPEQRKNSVTQMSAAFRLNLTILSGLALLVGLYLIMQAMEAAVVKRRPEIAILRSLGVTPAQIRFAWLLEALVLGAIGSALGVLLGRLLALGMVGGIARTVNTVYYQTTTTAVTMSPGEAAFSFGFGLMASLAAALVPAREASLTPPAQAMKQGAQGGGFKLLRQWPVGVALLLLGIVATFLPPVRLEGGPVFPLGGYVSAAAFVVSATILIGLLFRPVAGVLKRAGKSAMCRYAASQLSRPEGRHRLTAAGLAVAIGMSAAMGILVSSFEYTLTSWIGQLLKADIYISAGGPESVANESTISRETWQGIENLPGVDGLDVLRRYNITLDGREFYLGGTEYNDDPERYLQLIWLEPPAERGPNSLAKRLSGSGPDSVPGWCSESFARTFEKEKGDRVSLPLPGGEKSVTITGIYADYGNENGTLIVARQFTRGWFGDDDISQMAVYLNPGADEESVLESIRRAYPTLNARTNARLREESLRIFHQTFAVTYALEAIAVIIAVAGLGMALAGLMLERREELATLKSLGAYRREVARATLWEGVGLTVVGLIGGCLLSFVLGWILIEIVNPQSFGWTLRYRVPWSSFVILAAVSVATAAAVAWVVGYRNADLQSDRTE